MQQNNIITLVDEEEQHLIAVFVTSAPKNVVQQIIKNTYTSTPWTDDRYADNIKNQIIQAGYPVDDTSPTIIDNEGTIY